MALLGQALIRDVPDEYRIYSQKNSTYNGITQYNRNGLLWDKSMNVDGIKTGHTSNAGYSLVNSATEGKNAPSCGCDGCLKMRTLVKQKAKSCSYGFASSRDSGTTHTAGETFVEEKIWMGSKDTVIKVSAKILS